MTNRIPYSVWLVFNVFALLVVGNALKQEGLALFTYILICSTYVYAVAFLWCVLRSHLKISHEVNNIVFPQNSALERVDGFTNFIVSNAANWMIWTPMFYWIIRACILIINWLGTGDWAHFEVCDVYISLCTYNSKAIGLNQIVHWIGNADFGVLLLMICIPLAVVAKLLSNSLENE